MKVRTDVMTPLEQQELERARKRDETGKFDEMLAQEVQKATPHQQGSSGAASSLSEVAAAGQLHAVQTTAPVENLSATERTVMENIDSLLSKWENYAQTLSMPVADEGLRQAYGVLENIHDQVLQLKAAAPDLERRSPSLKSMVDELEILTVTEQFKFNRGDYL